MRLCRVTLTNSRNRSSFNKLLLISTFQEFRTRFEQSKAIERLERLERIGPRGERSKAIERLERLERLEPATASLMSDVPDVTRQKMAVCARHYSALRASVSTRKTCS
jgi:hypothetical protein